MGISTYSDGSPDARGNTVFSGDVWLQPAQADDDGDAARREAVRERQFIKVPNVLLGKILDAGRPSAYAAHLLTVKVRHGAGWALNQKHVGANYGIGERGFKQGIARLRTERLVEDPADGIEPAGAIQRGQPGPRVGARGRRGRWATSAMTAILQPGECGWVPFPVRLLGEDSFVVALVLAVLLSPKPIPQAEAAARFGVSSPATIRRLVKCAAELGAIIVTTGARGAVLLCRPAAVAPARPVSDRAARDPVKNVPAKNVTPYLRREQGTSDGRLSPPQPPATRCARRGGSREGERDLVLEGLRAEGQPPHVVEGLFGWFRGEGLVWWTHLRLPGSSRQETAARQLASARELCRDLARMAPRAIAAARGELRAGRTCVMPPVGDILRKVDDIASRQLRPGSRRDSTTGH